MDLLFNRYANPYIFLDSMLESGCFDEAVSKIWKFDQEDISWEYFLHKVWDKSFDEFKNEISLENESEIQIVNKEVIGATVIKSKNILDGFTPEGKE